MNPCQPGSLRAISAPPSAGIPLYQSFERAAGAFARVLAFEKS